MFSARHRSSRARSCETSTRRDSTRDRLEYANTTIEVSARTGIAITATEENPPPSRASHRKTILRRQVDGRKRMRRKNPGTIAPLPSQHAVQPIEVVHDAPASAGLLDPAFPLIQPLQVLPRIVVVLPQLDDVERHHVEALERHHDVAHVPLVEILFEVREDEDGLAPRPLFVEELHGLQQAAGDVGVLRGILAGDEILHFLRERTLLRIRRAGSLVEGGLGDDVLLAEAAGVDARYRE